ncbi:MAG: LamG-like jellyroll fold domain-containing protein [Campylobacterota bacterium]|nr:LamG-like jellyroll fold domain-containing protein [Campylobacterota bacterium]
MLKTKNLIILLFIFLIVGCAEYETNSNNIPVADAGDNQNTNITDTVSLNGSNSKDIDGDDLTYTWSIVSKPDGSSVGLINENNIDPFFQPDTGGEYIISLTVNDGENDSSEDRVTVVVVEINLKNGLVAHYEFEGNANDSSENRNHGTEHGGVTYADGVIGNAGSFGGYDNPSKISIANSDKLQFSSEATYTGWIKITELVRMDGWGSKDIGTYGGGTFFAKSHDRNGAAFKYHVSNEGVGSAYIASYDGWQKIGREDESKFIFNKNINDWAYVTLTLSASSGTKIYMDGSLWKTSSGSVDFSEMNNENLYIGQFSDSWYPVKGLIDDFRVYNRILLDLEIQELYNLGQ